jgi:hypothetical protein
VRSGIGSGLPGGCPTGQVFCGPGCADIAADPANCGACGRHCPVPAGPCLVAACAGGVCGTVPAPVGTACDDGDACTTGDVCTNGVCAGTPVVCAQACQACVGGRCQPIESDPDCPTGCCNGTCCAAHEGCVEGACQQVCLPVQGACDPVAPTCCDLGTLSICSYEANCTANQEEARCCRPIGGQCADRCDCCENADCVGSTCLLGTGQQCANADECAGQFGLFGDCCDGTCRNLHNDVNNCGECGNVCPSPAIANAIALCDSGQCTTACTAGFTLCGGGCVPLATDEANCGACGSACDPARTCCNGSCRFLPDDEFNCGACGNACADGETC